MIGRKQSCECSDLPNILPKFPFYKAFESTRTPFLCLFVFFRLLHSP